ncbi:hypothetical protein FRC00_005925 [Tulasnella sp. 408]|nr:hypothetical protein FRC00_005925 [Tulasnella sp. 408]
MNDQAQDFPALESCLQALERFVIDMTRLKFEEEYEEKRGGYSDVRVATLDSESLAPKLVAAKTIRLRALHKEPRRLALRLARELKVWARLEHPHILPLLGYYLEKDCKLAVLVSEYMICGDLNEYIEQEKPSWDLLLRIVRDATDGLAYLHQQKPAILHGDIKKGNVLINVDRRALLADFGLSKVLEEAPSGLTTSQGLKGTLRYFSPEILKGMDTGHPLARDIWAWACLVLEVLTDTIPYAEKKPEHLVVLALVNDELPADVESLSILHPDLKVLLARCWAIQPSERPSASFCLSVLNSELSTSPTPDHVEGVVVDPPSAATEVSALPSAAESYDPEDPEKVRWRYKDPTGQVQALTSLESGPFSAPLMQSWHLGNYFTDDLPLQRVDIDPEFQELQELKRRVIPPGTGETLFLSRLSAKPPVPTSQPANPIGIGLDHPLGKLLISHECQDSEAVFWC